MEFGVWVPQKYGSDWLKIIIMLFISVAQHNIDKKKKGAGVASLNIDE